ncbi:MAG: SWIM zinc finger family protein [Candidatus Thorarchaeota archaeon]|nr:MAG: SWIM zinc finger family protein [Candidatus Thorarchaeota archaeon]
MGVLPLRCLFSKAWQIQRDITKGQYHCNCPIFKHRLICSHILGVCQRTGVWPKEPVFRAQ